MRTTKLGVNISSVFLQLISDGIVLSNIHSITENIIARISFNLRNFMIESFLIENNDNKIFATFNI